MARALVLAAVLALVSALPAAATFPGENGHLVATYDDAQFKYGRQEFTLLRVAPRTGRVRRTPICGLSVSWYPPRRCSHAGPPAASPDGRTVGVLAIYDDRWSIHLISLAEGTPTVQTLAPGPLVAMYNPVIRWWPGGDVFLIPRPLPGATEAVWERQPARAMLVPRGGGSETELLSHVEMPDVAFDGALAFVRDGDVHVRDPSGAVRRLTRRGGNHPSWSPDGRFIAFSRRGEVRVMRSSGGPSGKLARGRDPVWSPDGRQIAFFRGVCPGTDSNGRSTCIRSRS
jgi:hypothetical protein